MAEALALALMDQVVRADPASASALANRGTMYAMAGRAAEAVADLERAFALGCAAAPAAMALANAYEKLRQFDRSLHWFDVAIGSDPAYPFPYYNRADVRAECGDDAGAIADLNRFLSFGPDERLSRQVHDRLARLTARAATTGRMPDA